MKASPEELLDDNVDEVRKAIRNADNPDYKALMKAEKSGKDRKTITKFLDERMETEEDSQETESGEEEEPGKESQNGDEEGKDNETETSGSGSKEEKLQKPLENLDDVKGIKGAAVVRRDGLLIASNFEQDINSDQVGAMTASTMGSGETASDALKMGEVEEVTVESEDGKLVSTGAGEEGILAILTDADVNMGLVKVEMGNAVEKIKRVL
ncbi:MAG: roadblock/LC7 domain-containing protein [Candidatus Nanohaloarchaea archaeon]